MLFPKSFGELREMRRNNMYNMKTFETTVGGKKLSLQIGRLAPQTDASVLVQYGDTLVLATAVMGKQPTKLPYFPLLVDYEERLYAAGKIKGSRFIKREGRPTDEAILSGRLIDRSIRPLFDQRLKRDVQVVITILSIDKMNDPDFPAMIAASAALSISQIPWDGPVAAVSVGYKEEKWIVNPTMQDKENIDLELFVSGKDDQVIMIEAAGKEAPEDLMQQAFQKAIEEIKPLTAFLRDVQKQVGKPKANELLEEGITEEIRPLLKQVDEELKTFAEGMFTKIMEMPDKTSRNTKAKSMADEFAEHMKTKIEEIPAPVLDYAKNAMEEELGKQAHWHAVHKGIRIDGRAIDEVRPLSCEIGLLPRAHGSGLFNRGETQVLSVATLGAPGDKQTLDEMETEGEKDYMHHYNFPGFSVGEVKPMRGPGRREIGHGALAEKAMLPVLPKDKEKFPYTIRVVSETLSSNGSSSQASVCGSTLALMDAGVPITAPVAGIAMGLMTDPESNKFRVLTDIQGIEDHAGYMDFKVAGTNKGITAIQLDIKLGGISFEVCAEALKGAKIARTKILDMMSKVIAEPKKELSQYAPRIESFRIDPDKIRDVIGPGGKVINEIIDATNVDIDIEDDGLVMVTSVDAEMMQKALKWIQSIVKDVEVGEVYEGPVTQIVKDRNSGSEIGAIVELTPSKDGMIHISALSYERVPSVSSVVKVGDIVKVKVMGIDHEKGRIELSRKALIEPPAGYNPDNDRPSRPSRPHDRRGGGAPRRRF